MKIARTPLFFGPDHRSLFGWFHAPARAASGDLAMVICPPVGHEYVNSHRPVRHLADRLAGAGVPVLRFDYDGTGDSAGSDEDPNRVGAWTQSVSVAMQTLREISGCSRIGLVGVRFGATLAVCAATRNEVACLVMWAPCVRGRAYAREMKALHLTGARGDAQIDGAHIEPGGFLMTDETQRDIGCINLDGVTPKTKRALIITRDDLGQDHRLADKWIGAAIATDERAVPGLTEMFVPPHSAVVPDAAIAETVDWIARDAVKRRRGKPAATMRSEQRLTDDVRESMIFTGSSFGILTEPQSRIPGKHPMILLSNAGATHHVGPNRLYVLLARRLARAGFRCLRFDLPGLGDNVIDGIAQENDPYLPTSSGAVATAIAAMQQQRDAEEFVLMGLCSGAHTSFHAALEIGGAPIVESLLINPLTFYYRPGMPLDPSPTNRYDGLRGRLRSSGKFERRVKQLRSHARIAFYRMRDIRPSTALALRDTGRREDDLERDLCRIIESGRKLTFVFSRFDPGYDLLMINAARVVKRFLSGGQMRLWIVEDASHTFEAKHSRDVMIDSVVEHLVGRYQAVSRDRAASSRGRTLRRETRSQR